MCDGCNSAASRPHRNDMCRAIGYEGNAVQSPFGSAHPRRCWQISTGWGPFRIVHGMPCDGVLEVSDAIPCNILLPVLPDSAHTTHRGLVRREASACCTACNDRRTYGCMFASHEPGLAKPSAADVSVAFVNSMGRWAFNYMKSTRCNRNTLGTSPLGTCNMWPPRFE